jgi:hypothetical protein
MIIVYTLQVEEVVPTKLHQIFTDRPQIKPIDRTVLLALLVIFH